MADYLEMAKRMFGMAPGPQAYSRITRTPINIADPEKEGAGATYNDSTDQITMPTRELGNLVPHESAHAIYNKAGLQGMGARLASQVPSYQRTMIATYPKLYGQDSETMADEGLGFSIGDPTATPYVNQVASNIKDPKLAQQLRRLHENAVQTKRYRSQNIPMGASPTAQNRRLNMGGE